MEKRLSRGGFAVVTSLLAPRLRVEQAEIQ